MAAATEPRQLLRGLCGLCAGHSCWHAALSERCCHTRRALFAVFVDGACAALTVDAPAEQASDVGIGLTRRASWWECFSALRLRVLLLLLLRVLLLWWIRLLLLWVCRLWFFLATTRDGKSGSEAKKDDGLH